MKTQAIRVLFAAVAAVMLAALPLVGWSVTVDVARFQQRYPWNGLVDIDYTITRNQGELDLDPAKNSVEIIVVNCDRSPAVTNVAHVFRQGALPVSDGTHRVTWGANAEGINFKSQSVKIFAEIVHYAEKYMVIDVSAGSGSDAIYPVTYLHGAPEGGFNKEENKAEYKGDKIVLRLIPPGSFVMGSPTNEPQRTVAREVQRAVAITKPFYIGVFEITQKQYLNVTGADPSAKKGEYRPVEKVSFENIRGKADLVTHEYDWPWTTSVKETSFMGKLRAKCKEWDPDKQDFTKDVDGLFDLPTEAQWEYACRAGTTTPFNNGVPCATKSDLEKQLNDLGRYMKNGGSSSQHAEVGTYAPNDWGLYDMHGNVFEFCLDWFREDVQNLENPSVDPVGDGASLLGRLVRGGGHGFEASFCRSAHRDYYGSSSSHAYYGFRLSRTLP